MPNPEQPQTPGNDPEGGLSPALVHSGCKVNLYLEITGILPNGYHSIRSLMLPLRAPFDRMLITPGDEPGLTVQAADFIDPLNNTLKKAYDLYAAWRPAVPGLHVELEKGVPHGAGLGGGSADAAALLLYLNKLTAARELEPLKHGELLEIAAKVGADVPFFILGQPAWAEGIGEKLTPAKTPFEGLDLVLICPDIKISTPWAYAAWDEMQSPPRRILTSFATQDTYLPSAQFGMQNLFNSFEEVVFRKHPEISGTKRRLLELGADGALMSGSGSSVFGLFSQPERARKAVAAMQQSGLKAFVQTIHAGASPSW